MKKILFIFIVFLSGISATYAEDCNTLSGSLRDIQSQMAYVTNEWNPCENVDGGCYQQFIDATKERKWNELYAKYKKTKTDFDKCIEDQANKKAEQEAEVRMQAEQAQHDAQVAIEQKLAQGTGSTQPPQKTKLQIIQEKNKARMERLKNKKKTKSP